MYGRQSLGLARSLAEDARRRAAADRRSAGYRTKSIVAVAPRPAGLRAWLARAIRPTTRRPEVVG
jgi:hypothetical protein